MNNLTLSEEDFKILIDNLCKKKVSEIVFMTRQKLKFSTFKDLVTLNFWGIDLQDRGARHVARVLRENKVSRYSYSKNVLAEVKKTVGLNLDNKNIEYWSESNHRRWYS